MELEMLHFRLIVAGLIIWLFFFYNIERIYEPFNIASFVYVVSALGAVFVISKKTSRQEWATGVFVASLGLLFVLKYQWGYPILGASLPITVTEVVAIGITLRLAYRLSIHVERFEEGAIDLALVSEPADFEAQQAAMYAEVRRAREFERPLTVAYLRGNEQDLKTALNSLVERSQRRASERFAHAQIAAIARSQLRDCDLLAQDGNGYVVMLPETDREQAGEILKRVETAIFEQLQVGFKHGLANLPVEEVTFTGLLERATESTNVQNRSEPTHTDWTPHAEHVVPDSSPLTPEVVTAGR